ncbi:YncE family protein, partial [Rhodococcus erythropolis]|uniref:YncE family protein n=1 Tax=Rhodococcus erythropolis TaxID=1833 RepID=UPI002948D9C4|nr:YncE family protein [Rhodococcus erythropolis]
MIDTTSDTVTATVPVGADPYGVAITPDGTRVYVTNFLAATVSVISINSGCTSSLCSS